MSKNGVLVALKALIYNTDDVIERGHNYRSALVILRRLKPSRRIIDQTVRYLLDVYRKQSNILILNSDALAVACSALYLGASKETGEEVMKELINAGWFRAEKLAHEFLGREFTRAEIFKLVKSYTDNKASRSESEEEKLIALAEKFLLYKDVQKVKSEIRVFVKDFNNFID